MRSRSLSCNAHDAERTSARAVSDGRTIDRPRVSILVETARSRMTLHRACLQCAGFARLRALLHRRPIPKDGYDRKLLSVFRHIMVVGAAPQARVDPLCGRRMRPRDDDSSGLLLAAARLPRFFDTGATRRNKFHLGSALSRAINTSSTEGDPVNVHRASAEEMRIRDRSCVDQQSLRRGSRPRRLTVARHRCARRA